VNLLCRNGNRIFSTAANDAYICALDFAVYERSVNKERFELFVLWGHRQDNQALPWTGFDDVDIKARGKRNHPVLNRLAIATAHS